MKTVISVLLSLVLIFSVTVQIYAENDHADELAEAVSGWKDVKQLYQFSNDLFAVTNNGKVLTTDESFKDCGKWSGVESIYYADFGEDGCLFAVCGNGSVLGLATEGAEELVDEVCGWKKVNQLYVVDGLECEGVCALCTDGSFKCTGNISGLFNKLSGVKLKDFSYWCSYDCNWAAVTQKGKVITNLEAVAADAAGWKNVEKLWLIARYDNVHLLGRTKSGGTVVSGARKDDCYEDNDNDEFYEASIAEFEKLKNISTVKWNYEDDWVIYITDSGEAGVIYLVNWGDPDLCGFGPYLKSIKNAVSLDILWGLESENTEEYLEYGYCADVPVFTCSDGTIANAFAGDLTFKFVPETSGAKVVSLAYYGAYGTIFGLTEKGTITRLHPMAQETNDASYEEDTDDSEQTPSQADLDAIETEIVYPKTESYLDEYLYGVITPNKGKSGVHAYYKPSGGSIVRRLNRDEDVTVIARQDGRYCVIVESLGKAYWVDDTYVQ